ncbi:MAG: hypothetical protein ACRDTN_00575 [Mycobacterium sp.]
MENEAAVSSDQESAQSDGTAAVRSAVAAADAAAAEAAARAQQARARAKRLHRHANIGPAHRSGPNKSPRRRRRWRLPRWRQLVGGVGVALVCASSAASGSMWWQHRVAAGKRQLAAEFTTAARQVTVALLTLDYTKTEERIQSILDNSTGEFKSRFQANSAEVGERLGQSKVVTAVDVKGAAVRSMSDNAGVVLVAVQTETTEMDGPSHPESWRMAVSLTRDAGQLKLSDVEFVE